MSIQLLFGPLLVDPVCLNNSWRSTPLKSIGFDQMRKCWKDAMNYEIEQSYFSEICEYVARERDQALYNQNFDQNCIPPNQVLPAEIRFISVHPAPEDVFAWTRYCHPEDVKVVIVGQDPYPNSNAHGLCFSALESKASIRNIFTALENDPGVIFDRPNHFNLTGWAKQGVLLLNRVLTVRGNKDKNNSKIPNEGPKSHAGVGWEIFTDAVIQYINDNCKSVVFMLWGNYAGNAERNIDQPKHLVLSAPHPTSVNPRQNF